MHVFANVTAQVISRPFSLDDPDSSYLIVGGLGGIGRAVASWLFEKGAKNIIVTSRKAESHPSAPELSSLAAAAGCRLLLRNCDTTQEAELVALISEASKDLPPIRGVINAAMVLDVRRPPFPPLQANISENYQAQNANTVYRIPLWNA